MSPLPQLQVDLRQMILAIETAVSLVGMNDTNHGKRVGYIASQIGYQLGFSKDLIQSAFEVGLLHDCGVSTEQMHANLVNHFDWQDAHIHCLIGYHLLKDFEPLQRYALPILHHHTPWQSLKQLDISPQDARMANLIFLSDRVDVMAASHYGKDVLLAREDISNAIAHKEGRYFDPAIVEAFMQIQYSEAFWIALEDRHIIRYTWDMGQIESQHYLTLPQLKQLSLIMAYIVDQKSPFTAQHSVRVASLARFLGKRYGLSETQCDKIEVAGLLHDLGKLHIPDNILEKPAPLNEAERAIMNQHSYETYEILRHIKGLNEIAHWAAYHHEGLNGTGYPFHPTQQELSTEARIIAVADVFQALVQDRPYRSGMGQEEVINILDKFATEGKLDRSIVDLAKRHAAECLAVASGRHNDHEFVITPLTPIQMSTDNITPH